MQEEGEKEGKGVVLAQTHRIHHLRSIIIVNLHAKQESVHHPVLSKPLP
jgi:hypothetical protein